MKVAKIVKMVPDVLKLFSKGKLDQSEISRLNSFGMMIAELLFSRRDSEVVRSLHITFEQEINRAKDTNNLQNNASGLSAFYWVITASTHLAYNLFREEEDHCFLLNHGLEHNLRPVLEVVGRDFPLLSDLRNIMKSNALLMKKLAAEKRTVDDEISALLLSFILEKYQVGNANVGLGIRGSFLLEQLILIEDFKGSKADLINELIKKKALRIGSL